MKIRLKDVTKKFDGFSLKGINLEILPGSYTVILGPSGAGKTLLLEMIAGLLQPDSGTVEIDNKNKIGFIYQDFLLFPHLTVKENISYGLKIRKIPMEEIKRKVSAISLDLNINHLLNREIKGLSGGEKQRIAIARALVTAPDVFLIDEPTASLDQSLKYKTQQIFQNLHKKTKTTFIHVTHDFKEALILADKVVLIMDGEIVQEGTPDEIISNPASGEAADFMGYKNVFKGKIKQGTMMLENQVGIQVSEDSAECAYIAIRSDEILIAEKKIDSSARNAFKGVIKQVVKNGILCEILVDIGIFLHIEITRKSLEEMKLNCDREVWISFKVSSVKVFKH